MDFILYFIGGVQSYREVTVYVEIEIRKKKPCPKLLQCFTWQVNFTLLNVRDSPSITNRGKKKKIENKIQVIKIVIENMPFGSGPCHRSKKQKKNKIYI